MTPACPCAAFRHDPSVCMCVYMGARARACVCTIAPDRTPCRFTKREEKTHFFTLLFLCSLLSLSHTHSLSHPPSRSPHATLRVFALFYPFEADPTLCNDGSGDDESFRGTTPFGYTTIYKRPADDLLARSAHTHTHIYICLCACV